MNPAENLRHDEVERPIAEVELTPEQLQTQILSEIMERYWVNMEDYVKNQGTLKLTELKNEINGWWNINEISERLYREYLQNNPEEYWNIDNLLKSIDSPRLNDKKDFFNELIDKSFESYEFLWWKWWKAKENLKLALINWALNWPIWENINATLWSFIQTFWSIDNLIEKIINWEVIENRNPVVSWRVEAFKELWENLVNPYKEKFDKINDLFNEKPDINEEQKQIIIWNIDWFRNPNLIEKWAWELRLEEINLDEIDLENLEYKELTEDERNNLIEYSMKSRENLVNLAKKLETWNWVAEFVYNIINKPWFIWEKAKWLMEMLLKIPFLWELIWSFLWLNSDNPIEELNENSRNIKLFNAIKWLWETKWENGEIKEWKWIFKNKDLKNINFNPLKNEIREIINLEWLNINPDNFKNFCEKAFSEQWFNWENEIKLEFKLNQNQETKDSLSNIDMKDILRIWINEYKEKRRNIPQTTEEDQANVDLDTGSIETPAADLTIETEETWSNQITTETESTETLDAEVVDETINNKIKQNAIDLLSWKTIEWLSNILLLWDYNDFKKIKLIDIINTNNLNHILRNNIGRSDYNNLSTEVKDSLFLAINIVKEFLEENRSFQTYQDWEWWGWKELLISDIISYNDEFKEYLSTK